MKIDRILNNNVVITLGLDGKEQIVCGKGIAFKKKIGDSVDETEVNKVFVLKDSGMNEKLQQLLMELPVEYISIADEILKMAELSLGTTLSDSLIVSLSDHIHSSILRFKKEIIIKNKLIWELEKYYEQEYEVGKKALEMINNKFKINLPEDEAGFITLHVINAEMSHSTSGDVNSITKIIQEICNIIRYFFHVEFDSKSVYYYRFITHLKFFAERMVNGNVYQDDSDCELFNILKRKYMNSYTCVEKISEYLRKSYRYEITADEQMYLMVHIQRVIYKTRE